MWLELRSVKNLMSSSPVRSDSSCGLGDNPNLYECRWTPIHLKQFSDLKFQGQTTLTTQWGKQSILIKQQLQFFDKRIYTILMIVLKMIRFHLKICIIPLLMHKTFTFQQHIDWEDNKAWENTYVEKDVIHVTPPLYRWQNSQMDIQKLNRSDFELRSAAWNPGTLALFSIGGQFCYY